MSANVDALLDALLSDQPADLSIERSEGAAEVKVGAETIARVDERHEKLVVYTPADVRSRLQGQYPQAQSDPEGLAFDLRNFDQRAAGLALLRNRARVQRVGWQYRERSP